MIVTCSKCNTRLELDETKMPSRVFKARCPKCHASVDIKSADSPDDAANLSLPAEMTPPSHVSPFEPPPAAAQYKPAAAATTAARESSAAGSSEEIAKYLIDLMQRNELPNVRSNRKRPAWDRRKALVCTDAVRRHTIAEGLVGQDYEVYVAENTAEALGRMRQDRIDVVVLDSGFDPVEQGFAFVTREIKVMRPAARRQLFLVFVTRNARTMDLHAAFLHNANLIVNPADIDRLPEALEASLSHYNELYREFYRALDMTPI